MNIVHAERVRAVKERVDAAQETDSPTLRDYHGRKADELVVEFVANMSPADIYTAQRMAREAMK